MNKGLVAKASVAINTSGAKVWEALVNPDLIKQYFFGATVVSDWHVGSPIVWKGEWQGKPYEDKGRILRAEVGHLLEFTHFSPLSGKPETPENYHTIMIELRENNGQTTVTLSQDNNATEMEREHSEKNWTMMLGGLKKVVEK